MPNNTDTNCTEKVCIQAKKVFDACVKQVSLDNTEVSITDVVPTNPTTPLTYVSCRSSTTVGTVDNLIVERLPDRPRYGRVQADILIPVELTYIDNNNVEGKGQGNITVPVDVIMYLPEPSIIPYKIEATVSAIAPDGTYVGQSIVDDVVYYDFTISGCSAIILKVTMDVELIVPTYGYAVIPPCQDFADDVCNGYFELPLYPDNGN